MPGSGSQQVLSVCASQDTYYIRPLLPRPGDRAELPNTEEQREPDKVGKQRNRFQTKEQHKTPEKELNETHKQ